MSEHFANIKSITVLIAFHFLAVSVFAQVNTDRLAPTVTGNEFVKSAFSYAKNKDYAGVEVTLDADVYKPNLFSSNLPLVIIYHGGGYANGNKNLDILRQFAESFTRSAITAVVPNFRQGWNEYTSKPFCESVSEERFMDAAYRAYQDNRALIRYCKANAAALGIDSNKIFLFGISSGGFLVNHHLYVDESNAGAERVARLGSLDLQGNTFTNSTDIAGIISVVGGMYQQNPSIIKTIPLLLFNNTCDGAVDFFNGWIGNCSNAVRSYGPGVFSKVLEQFNNPYSMHVFCGYNHGFLSDASPTVADPKATKYIADKSVDFIRGITQNNPVFSTFIASDSLSISIANKCTNFETFFWCKTDSLSVDENYFSLSPNPLTCDLLPKLNIRFPQQQTFSLTVTDELGRVSLQKKIDYQPGQNVLYLNNNEFTAGVNILVVKDNNGKTVYQTKVMRYCEN
jgi:hypothetical protein